MTTPIYPSKRYYGCAAKQATNWGEAAAFGPGDELLVKSDGDPKLKQPYEPYDAIHQVIPKDGSLGPSDAIDWAPDFDLSYVPGALGSLLANLFGNLVAPAKQGATNAYKHAWKWADEYPHIFTFGTERPGKIWEIPSFVPFKLVLKLSAGKIGGAISLRGNTMIDDSIVNTPTQMDAITPESYADFALFQNLVARINAESGDALDSGDVITLSDFELTWERTMDSKICSGGAFIAQPKELKNRFGVKLSLPRATAENLAYLGTFKSMTAQKMDFTITGPIAHDTEHYAWVFGFPRLKLNAAPDVPLKDIIENGLEFIGEEAAAAPAGMTGYIRPFAELVNLRTTGYLT